MFLLLFLGDMIGPALGEQSSHFPTRGQNSLVNLSAEADGTRMIRMSQPDHPTVPLLLEALIWPLFPQEM